MYIWNNLVSILISRKRQAHFSLSTLRFAMVFLEGICLACLVFLEGICLAHLE